MRRLDIDWTRGAAVLLMIEAHTLDAWTRPADRASVGFRDATLLAGFAAPLFLWIAGLVMVLSAARAAERTGSRRRAAEAVCRRGLDIFLLAFLFRLQAFVLSPGSHPVALFRVDILNIMGPALAAAGLVWAAARRASTQAVAFAAVAASIALATPIVRTAAAVDALPIWLQWYLRPAGEQTMFTLLPWAGFVFAGAACGALLAATRDQAADVRLRAALAGAGALLVAFGFWAAARPSIYRSASFWTSSPAWFAIRAGILLAAFAAIGAAEALARRAGLSARPLERLGRSSLFVYWIHVELVYGYATRPFHGRLPLWGTALAFAAFCASMYGAIVLRDRLTEAWRTRQVGPCARTATA